MAAKDVDVTITIQAIAELVVNNVGDLTFIYDEYADFDVTNDIGDVDYDLITNSAWEITGRLRDEGGDQTPFNWNSDSWTLTVNGVVIDESANTVIDTESSPTERNDALWLVTLNIPWDQQGNHSSPDCKIILTASAI